MDPLGGARLESRLFGTVSANVVLKSLKFLHHVNNIDHNVQNAVQNICKKTFSKGPSLHYSLLYYILLWIARKILSQFRGPFSKVQGYALIRFLIFNCGSLVPMLLLF